MKSYTAILSDGTINDLSVSSPEDLLDQVASIELSSSMPCVRIERRSKRRRVNPANVRPAPNRSGPIDNVFTVVVQGGGATLIEANTESELREELDRVARGYGAPVVHVQPLGREIVAKAVGIRGGRFAA